MSFVRMVTRERLNNLPTVKKINTRIFIQDDEYCSRLNDIGKLLYNVSIQEFHKKYFMIYHRNINDSYYHKEFIEEYEK